MIIQFSSIIPATVKCKDGKCYPCSVVSVIIDNKKMLPEYGIRFVSERPEFVIMTEIVVDMVNVNFGKGVKIETKKQTNFRQ